MREPTRHSAAPSRNWGSSPPSHVRRDRLISLTLGCATFAKNGSGEVTPVVGLTPWSGDPQVAQLAAEFLRIAAESSDLRSALPAPKGKLVTDHWRPVRARHRRAVSAKNGSGEVTPVVGPTPWSGDPSPTRGRVLANRSRVIRPTKRTPRAQAVANNQYCRPSPGTFPETSPPAWPNRWSSTGRFQS